MNRRNRRQIVRWIRLGVLAVLFIMLIRWLMPEADLDQETWENADVINSNYEKIMEYNPNNEEYVKIRVDAKVDSIVKTIKNAASRSLNIAREYGEDVEAEVENEAEQEKKKEELDNQKKLLGNELKKAIEDAHEAFAHFEEREKAEWRRILAWVLRANRETGDEKLDKVRELVNKENASNELMMECKSGEFVEYVKKKEQDSESVRSNSGTGNPEDTDDLKIQEENKKVLEAVKNLIEKYQICRETLGCRENLGLINRLITSGDKKYEDNLQWRGMKHQLLSKKSELENKKKELERFLMGGDWVEWVKKEKETEEGKKSSQECEGTLAIKKDEAQNEINKLKKLESLKQGIVTVTVKRRKEERKPADIVIFAENGMREELVSLLVEGWLEVEDLLKEAKKIMESGGVRYTTKELIVDVVDDRSKYLGIYGEEIKSDFIFLLEKKLSVDADEKKKKYVAWDALVFLRNDLTPEEIEIIKGQGKGVPPARESKYLDKAKELFHFDSEYSVVDGIRKGINIATYHEVDRKDRMVGVMVKEGDSERRVALNPQNTVDIYNLGYPFTFSVVCEKRDKECSVEVARRRNEFYDFLTKRESGQEVVAQQGFLPIYGNKIESLEKLDEQKHKIPLSRVQERVKKAMETVEKGDESTERSAMRKAIDGVRRAEAGTAGAGGTYVQGKLFPYSLRFAKGNDDEVKFDSDLVSIFENPEGFTKDIVPLMEQYGNGILVIAGYADRLGEKGGPSYNRKLSARRANLFWEKYMKEKMGAAKIEEISKYFETTEERRERRRLNEKERMFLVTFEGGKTLLVLTIGSGFKPMYSYYAEEVEAPKEGHPEDRRVTMFIILPDKK